MYFHYLEQTSIINQNIASAPFNNAEDALNIEYFLLKFIWFSVIEALYSVQCTDSSISGYEVLDCKAAVVFRNSLKESFLLINAHSQSFVWFFWNASSILKSQF